MCFVRDSGKCSTNCKCKEIESAKALPKATPMQNPSKLRHLRRTSCLQARHNRSALTVDRIFPFGSPKGDWSNRHVEKDPYPNGRSTRRHEDQLLLVNCHSLRPVSLEQFNSQHWTWQGWSYRLPREHLPGIPGGSPKDGTNYPNTKKTKPFQYISMPSWNLGSGTPSTSQGSQVSGDLKSYDAGKPPFSG